MDKIENSAVYFDDTGQYLEKIGKTYAEHPEDLPELCELTNQTPEEIQEDISTELNLSTMKIQGQEATVPVSSLEAATFFQNLKDNLTESMKTQIEDYVTDLLSDGFLSYEIDRYQTNRLQGKLEQDGLLQEEEKYLILNDPKAYFGLEVPKVKTAEDLLNVFSSFPELRITREQDAPCLEATTPVLSATHSSPMLIVPSSWIPAAMKEPSVKDEIQKGMDCDPRVMEVVYQKDPSLYIGQMARRALRDCLVYKTNRDSIYVDPHYEDLAKKILSFDSDAFLKQAVMECGHTPDDPKDPYYLAHLWETCHEDEIWKELDYDFIKDLSNDPVKASQKEELQNVIDCLKRGRPQEIEQLAAAYAAKDKNDLIPKALFEKEVNYQAERTAYRTYFANFKRDRDWPDDVEAYLAAQRENVPSIQKMILDDPFQLDSLEHAAASAKALKEDIIKFTQVNRTQEEIDVFSKKKAYQCYFKNTSERHPFLAQLTSQYLVQHYVPSTYKKIKKVAQNLQIMRKAYHLDEETVQAGTKKKKEKVREVSR